MTGHFKTRNTLVLLLVALATVVLALPGAALAVEPTLAGPLPGTTEWQWTFSPTGGYAFGSFSGDLLAYTASRSYIRDWNVYAYDVSTGQEYDVAVGPGTQRYSRAVGDLIAYVDFPEMSLSADIMLYDVTTGQSTNVTGAAYSLPDPEIALSERLLAWDGECDEPGTIWVLDLLTNEIATVTDAGMHPVASGDTLVWCSPATTGGFDIWAHDMVTGLSRIIATVAGGYWHCVPDISGDRVVYPRLDPVSGTYDICCFDLDANVETRLELPCDQSSPLVSGDLVAFTDWGPYFGRVWHLGTNAVYDVPGYGVEAFGGDHLIYMDSGWGGSAIWSLYTFSLDSTAPAISVATPAEGATYMQGQEVRADFSVTDDDSGVASVVPALPTSENPVLLDTSTVGGHTFTIAATDHAGNTSETTIHYTVAFSSAGLTQPVNADASSVFRGGSNVPLKFSVVDDLGLPVPGLQPKLYLARIDGAVLGDELEAVSTCQADVGNTFREVGLGQYQFNLSTKRMATGYWRARIDLGNGAQMEGYFSVS